MTNENAYLKKMLSKILETDDVDKARRIARAALRGAEVDDAAGPIKFTSAELLAAIDHAGFYAEMSVGHPFLPFPTDDDHVTLWCKACKRDSGYHNEGCLEVDKRLA